MTTTKTPTQRKDAGVTSTGFVFYDGPSQIDGAPIIGIAVLHSENRKTGDMVQTYILRADVAPVEAVATGADASICGDCRHRGDDGAGRTCYVNVGQSVQAVYAAWVRGTYPLVSPARAARMLAGRIVRIGSYGDPAAIPARHWKALIRFADGHAGYTHQWRQGFAAQLRTIVMASVDTVPERDVARALGWRTFRVRSADQPLGAREIVCPASPEGGDRRQCVTCRACDGADRPGKASVAIVVHGTMAKYFAVA
jgi:hypothetical protein